MGNRDPARGLDPAAHDAVGGDEHVRAAAGRQVERLPPDDDVLDERQHALQLARHRVFERLGQDEPPVGVATMRLIPHRQVRCNPARPRVYSGQMWQPAPTTF